MPIASAIAIYFVVWWISLFMVLPFGVRGQHEENQTLKGTEKGAPVNANIVKKFIQNSILATIIWAIIMAIIIFDLINLENIPFMDDFIPKEI